MDSADETELGHDKAATDGHHPLEILEIEELRRRVVALGADLAPVERQLRVLLRQRPLLALGSALAAGFILGRLINRSS